MVDDMRIINVLGCRKEETIYKLDVMIKLWVVDAIEVKKLFLMSNTDAILEILLLYFGGECL